MFIIPYRFDKEFTRIPFLTILVSLACVLIYAKQQRNEIDFINKTEAFCAVARPDTERMMLQKVVGATGPKACGQLLIQIRLSEDAQVAIDRLAASSEPFAGFSETDSARYVKELMSQLYDSYVRSVPPLTTRELWYHPHSWDAWSMVTATFAHGSWDHVIGNIIFFLAFASAVEVIIGPLLFIAVMTAIIFGTGVSYSFAMMNVADALPTVGLSGVVMGMLAMFTFFMPTGRIRCFYWFLIKIGTVAVPAWLIALWYIGFDVYQLFAQDDQSGINLVYHVSGAAFGFLIGAIFLRRQRNELAAQVG